LAKKTLKLVGETNAELVISPPRPLGKHGMQLWTAVHRQYDVGDAAGIEMLCQAAQSLDRAEACAALIAEQGELIHTRNGPKENPLCKIELGCRSFVVRTLARLGLDCEPIGRVGRPTAPWGMR
jgi:hypothetical protein